MALIRGRKLWMMYHPHEVPATLYDQLTARPMAWEWFRPTLEGMAEAERPLVCMQQVTGHDRHATPIRTLARDCSGRAPFPRACSKLRVAHWAGSVGVFSSTFAHWLRCQVGEILVLPDYWPHLTVNVGEAVGFGAQVSHGYSPLSLAETCSPSYLWAPLVRAPVVS